MPRRNNAAGRRAKVEGAASQAATLGELVEPGPDQAADETGSVELQNGRSATAAKHAAFDTADVSFAKDKTVMKKRVREGEGHGKPSDGSSAKLVVATATDGSIALPGFTPKTLEFTAGNGEVCDALECAVADMNKGEKAVLNVTVPSLAAEAQLGLQGVAADRVVLSLELTEFDEAKDTRTMSDEELIEHGTVCKEKGSELFKAGRLQLALQRYRKVGDMFRYMDTFKDEHKDHAKALTKACELNKAAVSLRFQNFADAKTACEAVLKDDILDVKATYRHAQAEHGLTNFFGCIRDCKNVAELDAANREARELLKQARASQKEDNKMATGMFANLFKAPGKSPVREPHAEKSADVVNEDVVNEDGAMGDEGDDTPADAETDAWMDKQRSAAEDLCSEAETAIGVEEGAQADARTIGKSSNSTRQSHRNRGPPTGETVNASIEEATERNDEAEEKEEEEDPDWSRLLFVVNQEAEQLMGMNPDQPVECALLRALWNHEKEFPMSLISRYQCMVAEGLAPADDDLTEAQWWCEYQPSGWDW